MLQFTTRDLKDITYYLEILLSRFIFFLIWTKVKKQSVYIDTNKYKFTYSYKKFWIGQFYIWCLVATHGLKNFITLSEFKKSGKYNVVFLNWG